MLVGYNVRVTGPKSGNQLCMTSEALYDNAFTFCFNAGVKYDTKAFSTVTTWAEDGSKVILYSDVYRATSLKYRPRYGATVARAQSANVNVEEARNHRGAAAFLKLEAYRRP